METTDKDTFISDGNASKIEQQGTKNYICFGIIIAIFAVVIGCVIWLFVYNTNGNKRTTIFPIGSDPIAPYSPATQVNGFIFISGQIGINPDTGIPYDNINDETTKVMDNIKLIIDEAGASMNDIMKTTILLTNISNFGIVNEIYSSYFNENDGYPARATFAVVALPAQANIEIEAIAYKR